MDLKTPYRSIEHRIAELEDSGEERDLLKLGNTFGQAVKPGKANQEGRIGGTVYTSFIDIKDNKFYLSYKLSNQNVIQLDLNQEFARLKRQKIVLKD